MEFDFTKPYCVDSCNDRLVLIYASRTPIGSYKGAYKDLTTIELASASVQSYVKDVPNDCNNIQALYAGIAMTSGLGQAVDKQIVLKSKLPSNIVSASVNKVCASGMKIVELACNELRLNYWDKVVLCVGAESMTRSTLNEGLVDAISGKHMGEINAQLADSLEISRAMQDDYAISSYERAIRAWDEGVMKSEIALVADILHKDEELGKYKPEKIPLLKPAFGSSVTAANASSLGDGAATIAVCKESFAIENNMKVLGEVVSYADSANDPELFGLAPQLAVKKLAKRFNREVDEFSDQIKLWEINEAFSTVAMANISMLQLDRDIVNIHGGAVAIGHPLGMSGTRIIVHMIHTLNKNDLGVCTICNGGGGASAILLRKV
ncbi:hypothetical protein GJ496_003371 [Pomphorhynchus laevis]|nr:hypothetical protein GJ496_003371 [Pomphorhynchus laevis]